MLVVGAVIGHGHEQEQRGVACAGNGSVLALLLVSVVAGVVGVVAVASVSCLSTLVHFADVSIFCAFKVHTIYSAVHMYII